MGEPFVLVFLPAFVKTVATAMILAAALAAARGASTVDAANRFAYGANVGWVDCRGDTTNGAVIGEYVCSGFLYAANVGWINLGSGTPINGIRYGNLAAADFGVNNDGAGNLSGFAWAANLGWISFESNGAPKVDLRTGKLSGFVYGANFGWISLSNAQAVVQTDWIALGSDADQNGLPDAWEKTWFGHVGVDPNADPDGDGLSNREEYWADTNPVDPEDNLRILAFSAGLGGAPFSLTWSSRPTRFYRLLQTEALWSPGSWSDVGMGLISPDLGGTTKRAFSDVWRAARFYRVEAVKPLSP